MNTKVYELIFKILESDLSKEDKSEIVRFYLLPRNTPVTPRIEIPQKEEGDVPGPVSHPTTHELKRKADPEMAEEEDAITGTLDGVLPGTKKK